MDNTAGVKHDQDKPRPDLLSPSFVMGISEVLTFGANKYGARNWEQGILYSRVFGAAQRHLWDFWDGRDIDGETGLHHLLHAGCCIMFLEAYEADKITYQMWDDRPAVVGTGVQ